MIHPQHRAPMRKAVLLLTMLALGVVLVWSMPAPPGSRGIAGYGPLHTLLETVAVVIAVLVFAVGWNANSRDLPGNTLLLACGFLGVALLDFSHALSFAGMPDYVTPSGPEKAINFWLAARLLAALTLLAATLAPWRPWAPRATRYGLLAVVLVSVALAHWVFLFHPGLAPRTFVAGAGLTPFKIASEYTLMALNLAAGFALWRRMQTPQSFNAAALFVAVCTMALSELFFTLYASVTDLYNLMGHLYKVIAYLFLYRAVFVETIERPYRELSEQVTRRLEAESARDRLASVLEAATDIIGIGAPDGQVLYLNRAGRLACGVGDRPSSELRIPQLHPPWAAARIGGEGIPAALRDGAWSGETAVLGADGRETPVSQVIQSHHDAAGKVLYLSTIMRDISSVRESQQALRVAAHRLQQATRLAHIGIYDHDHLTDTIYWSPEQRHHYGFSADEPVTPDAYLKCILPEDVERIRAAVQQAHDPAGDGLFDAEHRIVRRNGQVRVLATRSQTLFGGAGSARHKLRTIGAVLDITERKHQEEVLRASEENLAVTLQSIGDGVIATDLDGRVTRMNTVAERLTAWPLAQAQGQPLGQVFRIINAQSRDAVESPVQRVLDSGEIVGLANHTVLLAHDGREYHISDSAAPIRDGAGRVTGVVLVFSDVSEPYLAQQALRAHTDALRLRDRALTQISQGVMITDRNGIVTYVNPGFERLTGYTAAEALGRNPRFLQGEQTSPFAAAEIARALHEGLAYRGEILNQRKDGQGIWIELDIAPMRDDSGVLTGHVGTQRDITDRKQAEAQRRSLEAQLRESQKMESIGTLAGGIAHDFNNILGGILGNVALARGDLPAGHPAVESLHQISKAGARARDLVQQILTFSRRQPQAMVNQPLRPLVEETLSLLRSTLPAQVGLHTALADADLHIEGDGTQIQQVLVNLCTNAWHALQDSSGCITVGLDEVQLDAPAAQRLGGVPPGRYAHLWVRDTGSGMDDKTRARIFEPFFTTKPAGHGTGLGLSVVHGIVAAHGGAISVDSTPGQGSTFHIHLPARPAAPQATAFEVPTRPATLDGQGQHVMVIDDDEVMLLMAERLLQRAGYQVSCSRNPRDALATIRAAPEAVDLVVTDYNMPDFTGVDLAEALRHVRPGLPVVISSGYLSEELRAGAERAGVRSLLQKQRTLEELPRLLARLLGE